MLYQLGSQRIEIIVRKDNGASVKGAKEKDADQVSEDQTQSTSSTQGGSLLGNTPRSRFLRVNVTHGLSVARQISSQSLNFALQQIGNINGDQALQQNMSRQFEIVQDVTNVASSVSMGVIYGASGGPVGMILGGTFGALTSGFSLAFKYAGREREFNFKTFKENNAIEYQRARASISLTTGRLR